MTAKANALPSECHVDRMVQDWTAERFIWGGYVYSREGYDEHTQADAAAPVLNTLFFEGEHTDPPAGMTAHAALDSSER